MKKKVRDEDEPLTRRSKINDEFFESIPRNKEGGRLYKLNKSADEEYVRMVKRMEVNAQLEAKYNNK